MAHTEPRSTPARKLAGGVLIGAALVAVGSAALTRIMGRMVVKLSTHDLRQATVLACNDKWVLLTRSRMSAAPGQIDLQQGQPGAPTAFAHVGAENTEVDLEDAFSGAEREGLAERRLQARSLSKPVLRPVLGYPRQYSAHDHESTPTATGPLSHGVTRVSAYYWGETPRQVLGFDYMDVSIACDGLAMPAWLVEPPHEPAAVTDSGEAAQKNTWAILVHGRGAHRAECLRALPVFRELGMTSLVVTYRNALDAPSTNDALCHLGADEWLDMEAAIDHAVLKGAERIVLYGVSMGGQIALRTAALGSHGDRIAAIILDAPAVDWPGVLAFGAKQLAVPPYVRNGALTLLSSPRYAKYLSLSQEIPLHELTVKFLAPKHKHHTLILHSTADDVVPYAGSADLAQARPDLVELSTYSHALHTHEWNVAPERWERDITRFVTQRLQ